MSLVPEEAERKTFVGLEETFLGRVGSVYKTAKLSAELIRDDESGIITHSFRILTNAGVRKTYFDKAQPIFVTPNQTFLSCQ